jgi:hypothetical protein
MGWSFTIPGGGTYTEEGFAGFGYANANQFPKAMQDFVSAASTILSSAVLWRRTTSTSFSLAAADHGYEIWCSGSGQIDVTIPSTLGLHKRIFLWKEGAGYFNFIAGSGVTIHSFGGSLVSAGAEAGILVMTADDATHPRLSGALV